VFTATKAKDRDAIGDHVTAWLAAHPGVRVLRAQVTQSSDAEFHCLSIILFGAEA
jgi:folate-dependent tRNA-U54 methylase TrmFO/GidA